MASSQSRVINMMYFQLQFNFPLWKFEYNQIANLFELLYIYSLICYIYILFPNRAATSISTNLKDLGTSVNVTSTSTTWSNVAPRSCNGFLTPFKEKMS